MNKARRLVAESKGLCNTCGARPVVSGKKCERCKRNRREKRARALEAGKCQQCCANPIAPGRNYCKQCLAKHKQHSVIYRKNHWDKCLQATYRWKKKNKDKTAAIARRCYAKLRSEIFSHYGNKCVCCGESQEKFLTIDHKDNNGGRWRRENPGHKNGHRLHLWIKRHHYPKNLQLLCWNCNVAKGLYGKCPHRDGH